MVTRLPQRLPTTPRPEIGRTRTSPRPRHNVLAAALIAAVSLLGNGCSNNPYPPAESSANTHYINFGEDPKSLDPTFSFTTTESLVVDAVYPSFYRYHYLHQQPVRLIPNLGASDAVRKPMPDGGEEWTFTIRQGLRFQDDPCFLGRQGQADHRAGLCLQFQTSCRSQRRVPPRRHPRRQDCRLERIQRRLPEQPARVRRPPVRQAIPRSPTRPRRPVHVPNPPHPAVPPAALPDGDAFHDAPGPRSGGKIQ